MKSIDVLEMEHCKSYVTVRCLYRNIYTLSNAPRNWAVITHSLHMKASTTDKTARVSREQSVCLLESDYRGPTWPSPPSSACVVVSKGP